MRAPAGVRHHAHRSGLRHVRGAAASASTAPIGGRVGHLGREALAPRRLLQGGPRAPEGGQVHEEGGGIGVVVDHGPELQQPHQVLGLLHREVAGGPGGQEVGAGGQCPRGPDHLGGAGEELPGHAVGADTPPGPVVEHLLEHPGLAGGGDMPWP